MDHFDKNDFLELRPGALKELEAKFQKIDLLLERYEKELGADKVEEIRAGTNVEVKLEPGVSVNPVNSSVDYSTNDEAITSEPRSSSNDSSNNEAEATSVGSGSGSHDTVGGDSSGAIVDWKTQNVIKTEPLNPMDDVGQSEGITNKKRKSKETNNKNTTVSARNDGECDKENAAGSNTEVKVDPSDSQWDSRIVTLMTHHRAYDFYDESGQRIFNCICGYESPHKCSLEFHLRQQIFGDVFKCPLNCGYKTSYVFMFRNHCMNLHKLPILTEEGCPMCGDLFMTYRERGQHEPTCPGTPVMDAAMTTQL